MFPSALDIFLSKKPESTLGALKSYRGLFNIEEFEAPDSSIPNISQFKNIAIKENEVNITVDQLLDKSKYDYNTEYVL
jgi:hypothetical protein